jgi:serine/threonine-protein kinase
VLPVEEAVDCILQACEALAEAHSIGIVHRDLKPANLFHVTRADGRPFVKVLDFGISKMTDPAGAGVQMTRTSTMLGSPLYMSPEHLKAAKNADQRADVWSLGVILYELTTGAVPFTAETVAHLGAKILGEEPTALRALRPDLPAEFEAVVSRCLRKEPKDRYQSVGELARALAPFARDSQRSVERITRTLRGGSVADAAPPPSAVSPSSADPRAATVGAQTAASWGTRSGASAGPSRRSGATVAAVVAVAVVAITVVVAVTARHAATGNSPAGASPPTPAPSPAAATVAPVMATPSVAPTLAPPTAPEAPPSSAAPPAARVPAPKFSTRSAPTNTARGATRHALVIPDDRK